MKEIKYKVGDRIKIVRIESSWADERKSRENWENLIGTIHTLETVSYVWGLRLGFMNNLKPFNEWQNWYPEYLELAEPVGHQYEFHFMKG